LPVCCDNFLYVFKGTGPAGGAARRGRRSRVRGHCQGTADRCAQVGIIRSRIHSECLVQHLREAFSAAQYAMSGHVHIRLRRHPPNPQRI